MRGLGRTVGGDEPIGESWELADLPADVPGGRSTIVRGPGRGGTLRDLMDADRRAVLGDARPAADGGFPLLIKLLDAGRDLSVQVHPTPSYAAKHPGARLKTESWFVMDADPGARLLLGFRPEFQPSPNPGDLRAAARDGRIVDMLQAVAATPGSCHTLPSGLCHALGGGILALEVQTPSDTTFRLYDWDRDGRELHLDAAIACLGGADAPASAITESAGRPAVSDHDSAVSGRPAPDHAAPLARTSAYRMDLMGVGSGSTSTATITPAADHRPSVVTVVAGAGRLEDDDGEIELAPGTTVLVPAAVNSIAIRGSDDLRFVRTVPEAMED